MLRDGGLLQARGSRSPSEKLFCSLTSRLGRSVESTSEVRHLSGIRLLVICTSRLCITPNVCVCRHQSLQWTTWSGRLRACSGLLWKSVWLVPSWQTRSASLRPNPRTTAGRPSSTRPSSCEFISLESVLRRRERAAGCFVNASSAPQRPGEGAPRLLRAPGDGEGLLLRPGRPGGRSGRGPAQRRRRPQELRVLVPAGPARSHRRDGHDGAADPVPAAHRRGGEGVRQAEIGNPSCGGGQISLGTGVFQHHQHTVKDLGDDSVESPLRDTLDTSTQVICPT